MLYRQANNFHRQKLTRPHQGHALPRGAPVFHTLEKLKGALQEAIALEHFTIPPYLCTLYSIKDPNAAAVRIIRSVVVEEMLHMILAANILNAIGGRPRIFAADSLPGYPREMPHSQIGFKVNLLKFCPLAINTFLRIERPSPRLGPTPPGKFWSIGEFYAAVREALHRLNEGSRNGIFTGKQIQVTGEHFYYNGGGKLTAVHSIADADRAIDEIVGQGEGIDGTIETGDEAFFNDDVELAHYFRFNEILQGRRYRPGDKPGDPPSGEILNVDWDAVYNMVPNPTMSMFKQHPALYKRALEFNQLYSQLLVNLDEACNGKPEVFETSGTIMNALRNSAVELMNDPIGDGDYTAGPTFEFVPIP